MREHGTEHAGTENGRKQKKGGAGRLPTQVVKEHSNGNAKYPPDIGSITPCFIKKSVEDLDRFGRPITEMLAS